jgi:LacI family transcriptional regulator
MLPKAEIVEPLYYSADKGRSPEKIRDTISPWLRRHRPDVIVGHEGTLVEIVESIGYRVPEEIGIAHLATDDDVRDWAGINSKRREIGAAAAETLISLMQNRKFGVPNTALTIAIRGTCHNGRTLLFPKPK